MTFLSILFTLIIVPANASTRDDLVNLAITIPTSSESTIAPNRDFYVIGTINGAVPDDARLSVDLYKDGSNKPVREVYTQKKDYKDGLYVDYPGLSYYGGTDRTPLKNSCMPDLVYDPVNKSSFKDAWRKCYYNDSNFTALICGGEYRTDINLANEDGSPFQPLDAGQYTIQANLASLDGANIASVQKSIKIGYTEQKVLSRFSPDDHFNRIKEEAQKNNYRIYLDPFPGNWSPASFIQSLKDSNLYCEITPKWKLADSTEYKEGHANFYIYNDSTTSATYSVEIGMLQHLQAINNPSRLTCYYYNLGEPTLPNGNIQSGISPFEKNDHLQFTRADFEDTSAKDNVLDTSQLANTKSDLNVSDGIDVCPGQTVSINGVVTPIQNEAKDITINSDNTFTFKDRIASIAYEITSDNIDEKSTKSVGLTRIRNGKNYYSDLEFKHDFKIDENFSGKDLSVTAYGLDSYGKVVAGTNKRFTIRVAKDNAKSKTDSNEFKRAA